MIMVVNNHLLSGTIGKNKECRTAIGLINSITDYKGVPSTKRSGFLQKFGKIRVDIKNMAEKWLSVKRCVKNDCIVSLDV